MQEKKCMNYLASQTMQTTNSSLENNSESALSQAQEAFLKYAEIDHNRYYE